MSSPEALASRVPEYAAHLLEQGYTRTSMLNYRNRLHLLFRWLVEEGRGFDLSGLLAYRDHLQELGRRPRTIAQAFVSLRGFVGYLLERGELQEAPDLTRIRLPRRDPPQRYIATDAEVQALFTAADRLPRRTLAQRFVRSRAQAVLAVLCFTGVRRSELLVSR